MDKLTHKELDCIIEVFDFYIEHKLKKDTNAISKYLEYAEKIGEIHLDGKVDNKTKKFYTIKQNIRKHIDAEIVNIRNLRNKLLNHFII